LPGADVGILGAWLGFYIWNQVGDGSKPIGYVIVVFVAAGLVMLVGRVSGGRRRNSSFTARPRRPGVGVPLRNRGPGGGYGGWDDRRNGHGRGWGVGDQRVRGGLQLVHGLRRL
jgi:hypothetical protein